MNTACKWTSDLVFTGSKWSPASIQYTTGCGYPHPRSDINGNEYNYCPYCGQKISDTIDEKSEDKTI
ncbi:MAG: hypothetical protein EO766_11670 [Hydrotalea sp. AMD]|uniref:hypothetical protein n=1 Tax=Hydrotalea sp. AMD TaxID=2501297 RepID=UPI00102591B3|nr:hypothetical protein [Hydrotalea sp. AMD]RWZ87187.1 MAG: hypothetical protein EO766_11670 [Hydrotalea sp. AMD]